MRVSMLDAPENSALLVNTWSSSARFPHRADDGFSSMDQNQGRPMVKRDLRLSTASGITAHSDSNATRYRVLRRKRGRACDVEMKEADAAPRIVIAFDTEAEAWDWVGEQQTVNKFAAGRAKDRKKRVPASLAPDELTRLGELAVTELERRGYDVRGKSADQIKKILRFPPPRIGGQELP
jgi:hypothetical protein